MEKPRFKPELTRIKLNPEQAVLSCSCYIYGYYNWGGQPNGYDTYGSGLVCGGSKSIVMGYGGNRVTPGVIRAPNTPTS